MQFKFTLQSYIMSLVVIWFTFILRSVYLFIVCNRELILFEILLSAVILHFSIGTFLINLYKYKMVKIIDVFKLAGFVYLVLNYLIIADDISSGKNSVFGIYYISEYYIVPSLLTIIIGLLALNAADFIFKLHAIKSKAFSGRVSLKNLPILRIKNVNFFIYFSYLYLLIQFALVQIGLIGFTASIESSDNAFLGPFGFLLQIYQSFSQFIVLTYLIIIFLNKANNSKLEFHFRIFVLLYIITTLFAGAKGPTIIIILQLLLFYLASGRKIPFKYALIALPVIFLIFPIVTNFRDELRSGTNTSRLEILGNSVIKIFENKEKASSSADGNILSRISLFPYMVYAVEHESDWHEYKNMDRYVFLPVSIIPRAIIPQKPVNDTGGKLNHQLLGLKGSSITPTSFGWSYYEGGYVFVFISFFLLGVFFSFVQYKMIAHSAFYCLYLFSTYMSSITVENDIYFMLAAQIMLGLNCWLFSRLFLK